MGRAVGQCRIRGSATNSTKKSGVNLSLTLRRNNGVSDVGLAKVCRKLQVPLPGRGYWDRKQHGYAVSLKPLPKLKEPIVEAVLAEDARKAKLSRLLGGDESPALLFTASHGGLFPNGHRLQLKQQGCLICQDWPGQTVAGIDTSGPLLRRRRHIQQRSNSANDHGAFRVPRGGDPTLERLSARRTARATRISALFFCCPLTATTPGTSEWWSSCQPRSR